MKTVSKKFKCALRSSLITGKTAGYKQMFHRSSLFSAQKVSAGYACRIEKRHFSKDGKEKEMDEVNAPNLPNYQHIEEEARKKVFTDEQVIQFIETGEI